MTLCVVILAAGQGTRMRSTLPKVLHPLAGIPLIERVIQTALSLGPEHIYVIYGHGGDQVKTQCQHYPVTWVQQEQQRGTGHAVLQVLPYLTQENSKILILSGDVPLISTTSLLKLVQATTLHHVGLLTATFTEPKGLGRIIRDRSQSVVKIVEEKDANEIERAINEINAGIYVTSVANLQRWLPNLSASNAQQEFYLTDIIRFAFEENIPIHTISAANEQEVQGINDRQQLIHLERYYQTQLAKQLLLSGVTILDPARFDVRGEITIASDVIIDVNVIFEGKVHIESGCIIGANSVLRNVKIGKNVEIKPHCVIEDAVIADNCKLGPFARIRPGTTLAAQVSVGNFVEIKNSHIGVGSKIPHLSYVGDTDMGERVNFGAGAITCNYNGMKKSRTVIGNDAFIGSDSQLIAPISIGEGAYVAAGSTISKNAPANKLTIGRAKQQTLDHWQRPKKEET